MICRQHRLRFHLRFSTPNIAFRCTHSSASKWKPLQELQDGRLDTFRREAFAPSQPAILPRGEFLELPAIHKWFSQARHDSAGASLNHTYLSAFGNATLPLECTRLSAPSAVEEAEDCFQRAEVPLNIFLEWTRFATIETQERLYVAQASFASLPQAMAKDLATPDIVAKAGTGDIYDTSIWLGIAPTYTPLHRDPNPNLFVQLAGHKVVRMLPPDAGDRVFTRVQSALGRSGSAIFRGEEMMKGEEKKLLEAEIWDVASRSKQEEDLGLEAHVWGGDGLFIPKGWWHSIKGVDGGVLGSVNWWFR